MFANTTRPEAARANTLYHEFWHVASGNVGDVGMVRALIDPTFQGSESKASELFDNWLNVQKCALPAK